MKKHLEHQKFLAMRCVQYNLVCSEQTLEDRFVLKLTPFVAGLVTAVAVGDCSDCPEEVKWKDELLQPLAQASLPTVLRWEGRPPTGTVWWWWSWGGQWTGRSESVWGRGRL